MGEELANETHLTNMRENIAGLDTPFNSTDPSSTIEEMRMRLNRPAVSENQARLAEAERQLEEDQKRARIDEMLARYKGSLTGGEADRVQETAQPQVAAPNQTNASADARPGEPEEPDSPKTLGRNHGPLRPID